MIYIVIELQTNADGTVGNIVWSFDDRSQAESKYHAVLSAAAISALPMHAACLMETTGRLLDRGCYDRRNSED